jgi:hypothetical protein
MPTYEFRNKKTGKVFEEMMTMAEFDIFKKDNPHLEPVPHAPKIVSGVMGARRSDDNFKDVLRNIKHNHPKATFDPDADPH